MYFMLNPLLCVAEVIPQRVKPAAWWDTSPLRVWLHDCWGTCPCCQELLLVSLQAPSAPLVCESLQQDVAPADLSPPSATGKKDTAALDYTSALYAQQLDTLKRRSWKHIFHVFKGLLKSRSPVMYTARRNFLKSFFIFTFYENTLK